MSEGSSSAANLCEYLEASAQRFGDRVAVVDPDGSSVTYRQLNGRADRIAGFLLARGLQPGDRVGLVQPKSVTGVCAIFGILKARCAYVPIDSSAPAARIRSILGNCHVRAVFASLGCAGVAADVETAKTVVVTGTSTGQGSPGLPPGAVSWEKVLEHEPGRALPASRHRDDVAYILYTSGSTGIPKGVTLTHENALSFVDWCTSVFNPDEHDRFSSHAPFHFDLSILDLYLPLKHGSTLYLISEELGKNPAKMAAFIALNQLTVWYSTPSILSLLAEFGNLKQYDYSHLRLVLFAGEVFPVKHLRNITAHWPFPVYFNLYGPTETNVCTFARIPTPIPPDRTQPYPIGWPCSHCAALVVDDAKVPVPKGEEGLLYISGSSVFKGYWGQTGENPAFFERDGQRWYNTGDVVKEDPADGFIYVGRRDRMVKRRGYRIELGDIESALYRHQQISEAAVVAIPDADAGVKIHAYVATVHDPAPSIVDLKVFCSKALPAYMSPDAFLFRDSLPRTSTDKVDYQKLQKESAASQSQTK
ncbi:MAG: D-alanine--poly(phosphoribitol) ligase [Acidobacteria bacterium]|nr:MAG: D-alanine--poly(phosphoribitol) ligase [Acidobacteriota bacterium]